MEPLALVVQGNRHIHKGSDMSRIFVYRAMVVVALVLFFGPGSSQAQVALSFEEKLLLSIPADHVKPVLNKGGFAGNSLILINNTRTQGAYSASKDGRNFVVVGKEKGPDFEGEISSLMLSNDGKTVVYAVTPKDGVKGYYVNHKRLGDETTQVKNVARNDLIRFDSDTGRVAVIMQQGGKEFAIVDGKKGPEFDGNTLFTPTFSADGKRFGYQVRQSGKPMFMMIDDQKGIESTSIERPVFSPDGGRVAYAIHDAMVVDGRAGPTFKGVNRYNGVAYPTFTPDGKRFAYVVAQARQFVLADNRPGPAFQEVATDGRIVFSPDGKRIAYKAKEAGRAFVVVDEKTGELFDDVTDISFSPDGKRLVYRATLGNETFLVDNGNPGPKFPKFSAIFSTFSSDGATHAYVVAMLEKQSVYVVNGKASEPFFNSTPFAPAISPDGKQVSYSVNQQKPGENKGWVVINDKPGEIYDGVAGAVFSPDSSAAAYVAAKGGKQFIVLNGKPGPPCDSARNIVFSADSKKVAYIASTGNEIWWKVLEVAGK